MVRHPMQRTSLRKCTMRHRRRMASYFVAMTLGASAALITATPVLAIPRAHAMTISHSETLTKDITCSNLTIDSGVTLTTNGYNIYCSGAVINAGTIVTGSSPFENWPDSYGGSGGGATNLRGLDGPPTPGFNTIAPGGTTCTTTACTAGNGASPTPPTLTDTLVQYWIGAGPKKFLIGAGGGSSPFVKGGAGAHGLLISANSIDAGAIDAAGRDGKNDPGQSTAGGGGGGVIVLAYGDGGYTPGSYNVAGGYNVTANGTDQGFGGNGQVLTREVTPFIFDDGFQGSKLSSAWTAIAGPGDPSNTEQECYSPQNVTVTGGTLSERAEVGSISNCDCPSATQSANACGYISGAVQWTSLSFTYGTVSVRAKLAGGKGPWPAIWLLGADCQSPTWLQSSCPWPEPGSDEIDIAEVLQSNHTDVNEQIHTEDSSGTEESPGCTAPTSNVSQNWHTYTLIWAPGSLTWKIDGVQTCQITSYVPTTPMFLIIDTAVGGAGAGIVRSSTLPQTTEIDYVGVT